MGTEKMSCCGALTRVYTDAGGRRHLPGCKHWREPAEASEDRVSKARLEAVIRLLGDEHLTPVAKRQLRAVLLEESGEAEPS